MIEYVDVNKITPAPYNPRRISAEQFSELQESIREIGFVVPILINRRTNIIIAGHQRSKSAKAVGLQKVPAIFVDSLVEGDEIKFNQMHNGTENKDDARIILTKEHPKEQFITIPHEDFDIDKEPLAMTLVRELCKLIMKYGNVLSTVVCRNRAVFAREYIYACRLLDIPVNGYICDDSKWDAIQHYFNEDYGEYSYDGIKRNTYVQGLAQLNRVTEKKHVSANGKEKRVQTSVLYETMVKPYLAKRKNERLEILDFGCGKGAYINMLAKTHDALGIEFYNHNGHGINVSMGNRMIDALIDKVKHKRMFDVVVCDSVLNSVDSVEAENSVMACLNLFASDRVFLSGRLAKEIETTKRSKTASRCRINTVYFLDENGLSATYRKGQWFFQKFHEPEQLKKLAHRFGFEIVTYKETSYSWQMELRKVRELSKEEYTAAIDFEFNLPLPNGKRYNRNADMKKALGL